MARTAIPLSPLAPNGSLANPAGTGGDHTNHHVVAPFADWPNATLEEIVLRVTNGGGAPITVTVLAGDNPPALEAGDGNLAVPVAAGATAFIGPFTSGRFLRKAVGVEPAGLYVNLSASASVTVTAFHMPRTA